MDVLNSHNVTPIIAKDRIVQITVLETRTHLDNNVVNRYREYTFLFA